jgi:NtrC-family two-component system sensor histidine kinase KinB
MRLGTKLRIGFTIPLVMLLASGVWSYVRFNALSQSVENMLDENDRSIQAANEMILALERMDSASLLHLAGQPAHAEEILDLADSSFAVSLRIAEGNMTIGAEPAILDSIKTLHAEFASGLAAFARAPSFEEYRAVVLPSFLDTKHAVSRLRRVNQVEMQDRAVEIGRHAYRASLPSAVLALSALLFTLMFAWLTHVYAVRPIHQVLHRAHRWADGGEYTAGGIETRDEIQELDEVLMLVDHRQAGPGKPTPGRSAPGIATRPRPGLDKPKPGTPQ